MTYYEKLRDPRWQRKRLEIMQRDDFACKACAKADITLNVHHRIYLKKTDPWDYPEYLLVTLCEPCHQETHAHVQLAEYLMAGIKTGCHSMHPIVGLAAIIHALGRDSEISDFPDEALGMRDDNPELFDSVLKSVTQWMDS